MIDSLSERDQFAVLVFDHQVETPPSVGTGLVRGSDRQRFRVVEFLATVDARGGTEMAEPLRRAVKLLADTDGGSDRTLVLITDGQVGNEDQLLRELAGSLTAVRVFTLGIDTAVNAGFLRRFAAAGGGACELVESEDRLDEVMAKLHRRIATPCATDLSIRGEGLALEQVSPGRIPALFTGAPVLVAGRTTAGARGAVVVTGRTPGGQPWQRRILLRGSAGDSAAAMWARARIRDLEDGYASGDHSVEAEIVAVSVRHRVLSRFTAFVAIDRTEVVVRGGNPRAIVQPVELPAGWPEPFTLTNAHPLRARALPRRATPAGLVETFAGKLGGPGSRGARALRQRLASPPASVDGTPYRARARDIADAIDRAAAASDRCALDLALARLVELIEDLRSIGGFEALILALDRIAEELRRELGGSPETWRERAAELRDAGASKPGQARSFWK